MPAFARFMISFSSIGNTSTQRVPPSWPLGCAALGILRIGLVGGVLVEAARASDVGEFRSPGRAVRRPGVGIYAPAIGIVAEWERLVVDSPMFLVKNVVSAVRPGTRLYGICRERLS